MSAPRTRTYKRRAGRISAAQTAALERLRATHVVAVDGRPLDLPGIFERIAPLVLEIGSGMGDATARMALGCPEMDVLAVEVHSAGIGNLLRLVEQAGLTNVRVADGDAVTLLREMLGSRSLTEVRIFFPDPWPKSRHAKRRLVTRGFADLLATRLRPGGRIHVATDVEPYARMARRVFHDHPRYRLESAAPPRPVTGYERRGLAAGREAIDLSAVLL